MPPDPCRILLVDVLESRRQDYAEALRGLPDLDVIEVATAQEALVQARERPCSVHVVALHPPDMDGFELAALLRQECPEDPPAIILLADEAAGTPGVVRGYRMGAMDVIVEGPVGAEILVQKARVLAQIFRRRHALEREAEAVRRENAQLQAQLADYARQQEILRTQATHDTLTHLPNRALFQDRLDAALARARRARQRFAVAYLDLDGFKSVNDRHGHSAGDALLIAVANRLLRAVRATDTVARIGGDEFALLFEGLDSPRGAEHVARKAGAALVAPVTVLSEPDRTMVAVRVGASIGVAVFPDHATTADELTMLADVVMYDAKRAGGGVLLHGAAPAPRPEAAAPLRLVRPRDERTGLDR